jgi:CAAX prenyl protease-like protein
MKAPIPIRDGALMFVCAAAGTLAVPLHRFATPLSAVVAALIGLLGLRLWRWSRLPSASRAEPPPGMIRAVAPAAWGGLGLLVGLLLLGAIRLAVEPALPAIGARMAAAGAVPVWRRAVIIYVPAVGEELLFRVLLLSLVAGAVARLLRLPDRAPNRGAIWAANVVAALLFGAVHLPSWTAATPVSPALALAVVSLNAVGGAVFGYVFAHRGVGAAMWAHAGADCAIQFIGPLTG